MTLDQIEQIRLECIGKTLPEVTNIIKSNNMTLRVMREDKLNYFGTCDFNMERANLQIDNGIVTKVSFG